MSEETGLTLAGKLASLAAIVKEAGGDAEDRFLTSVDAMKLVPKFKMNKDTLEIALLCGGSSISRKVWYLNFMDLFGTKALWPPEKDKEVWGKRPVCSIGFTDPKSFAPDGGAVGQWQINERYGQPYDDGQTHKVGEVVGFSCDRCPWNRFETRGEWEHKETSSKSKACGEARVPFVLPMAKASLIGTSEEGVDLYFFAPDPFMDQFKTPFAMFSVSWGTNRKQLEELALKCQTNGVPVTAAVFKVTAKKMESGGNTYAILQVELAGVSDGDSLRNKLLPAGKKAKEFAKEHSNVVLSEENIFE